MNNIALFVSSFPSLSLSLFLNGFFPPDSYLLSILPPFLPFSLFCFSFCLSFSPSLPPSLCLTLFLPSSLPPSLLPSLPPSLLPCLPFCSFIFPLLSAVLRVAHHPRARGEGSHRQRAKRSHRDSACAAARMPVAAPPGNCVFPAFMHAWRGKRENSLR